MMKLSRNSPIDFSTYNKFQNWLSTFATMTRPMQLGLILSGLDRAAKRALVELGPTSGRHLSAAQVATNEIDSIDIHLYDAQKKDCE